MKEFTKPFVISDKEIDEGHRAHYLGHTEDLSIPFSISQLRALARGVMLTKVDQGYFEALIQYVESRNRLPYSWTLKSSFLLMIIPKQNTRK